MHQKESNAINEEECLDISTLPHDAFPFRYDLIRKEQQKAHDLIRRVDQPDDLTLRPLVGSVQHQIGVKTKTFTVLSPQSPLRLRLKCQEALQETLRVHKGPAC